jgi:menaquinone-dependent protoporphyrinogen oxidase
MANKILLAYATKYGSTKEVAEAVAKTLENKGLDVDMQQASQVRSVKEYNSVILGAPLYMYRWHKHAVQFLKRHEKMLKTMPVVVFATGPSFKGDEKEWLETREQFSKELANFPWFKPIEVEVLGGKFDPANLGFPMKHFLKDLPAADLRDWDAIAAWAAELAGKLQAK